MRTYSTLGAHEALDRLRLARRRRARAPERAGVLRERLLRDVARIEATLGGPLRGRRILEIGPGQDRLRSSLLALDNRVVGLDLDVVPDRLGAAEALRILRSNGPARLVKTAARRVLLERIERRAWLEAWGQAELGRFEQIQGDVCHPHALLGPFDVVASWSVFEHLGDPAAALRNAVAWLAPGGVLYVGIHLYTSNTGHHDIRAFGSGAKLPAWGHLRAETRAAIRPSAVLNRWRLRDWRQLFAGLEGGADEFLETYDCRTRLGPLLTPELREELSDYSDEELFTVDAFFRWQKPAAGAESST